MKQSGFNIVILLLIGLSGCNQDISVSNSIKVEINTDTPYELLKKEDASCVFCMTDTMLHTFSDNNAKIKLRGNSTAEFPKRPFTLKLSKNSSLCGMPEAKKWVLLANYFDKTMLRNALAFKMSEDSKLTWTPHFRFVELYYNGVHNGTYQLCEKVEVNNRRVEVPPDGWLIEVDARVTEEDTYFTTNHMEHPFRIDYPDKNYSTEQIEQIHNFIQQAEDVLFGEHFTNPDTGWRKYLDEESWIDWLLINEIAKNGDGNFYSSCWMHSGSDGKILMGPIWDYDTCFGNNIYEKPRNPEGFYVLEAQWFMRLMEDPLFAQDVRERFLFFYNNRSMYYDFIRKNALRLRSAVDNNDTIWHTIGTQISPYLVPNQTYDEDIEELIQWLQKRFEWLKNNFNRIHILQDEKLYTIQGQRIK